MIDQQEFHNSFLATLDLFRFGPEVHTGRNIGGTSNYRLGYPANFGAAIFFKNRIARGPVSHRSTHFNQAHPAVSCHAQVRMVTVMRNFLPVQSGCFNCIDTTGYLNFLTIEVDCDQFLLFRRNHCKLDKLEGFFVSWLIV